MTSTGFWKFRYWILNQRFHNYTSPKSSQCAHFCMLLPWRRGDDSARLLFVSTLFRSPNVTGSSAKSLFDSVRRTFFFADPVLLLILRSVPACGERERLRLAFRFRCCDREILSTSLSCQSDEDDVSILRLTPDCKVYAVALDKV